MKLYLGLFKFFTLMICLMSCDVGFSEQEKSLNGKWKFTIGDNSDFSNPDFDDSDWVTIKTPGKWKRQGYGEYNGFAWYRKEVDISFKKQSGSIFLELGYIDDADETYFNGYLIGKTGSFPPGFKTAYQSKRVYEIPNGLINWDGKNVIAVRVYDDIGQGGIIGSKVAINYSKLLLKNSVDLQGVWKFQIADDLSWSDKEFDDFGWEDVNVPGGWETQGFRNYDGIAWYRKKFELPRDFETDDLILIIGKIDDTDQTYINGIKIGSTGRIGGNLTGDYSWQKTRSYSIPQGLLKAGETNSIAIRVYDWHNSGGIIEGPVIILKAKDYKEFWKKFKKDKYNYSGYWIQDYL